MSARARALRAGAASGVGSLPHVDPAAAALVSLRVHPELPAMPELPNRDEREGMLARWLDTAPGVVDPDAHAGMAAFLSAARAADASVVKAQLAGPLTLGLALMERGKARDHAFAEAAERSTRAAVTILARVADELPHADPVLFLDEPALVTWRGDDAPLDREAAVDALSGVLSSIDAIRGVHVCGDGDRRMAIEAGPDIVGFAVSEDVREDGVALGRYLDGGGWIAWGAVPTDRPVGDSADHWWNELVGLWCDLTRAGCDPVALRTQALITPACGLAHHSEQQATRILEMCVEIGERVREQAVATRLSVGA